MHQRYDALAILTLIASAAVFTACSGSAAITTPTVASTVVPATAAASIAAPTRPVGSAATGVSVIPTAAPTIAANSPSAATRPASSGTAGALSLPTIAPPASAVTGTRTAGATTGSVPAGTAAAGSASARAALTRFTDPRGAFSFSRPDEWTVGQSSSTNSIVQYNTMNPLGVVDISTEPVAGGITPDAYRDASLAEIRKGIPDARQLGMTSLTLDTEPAVQIDYTGTVSGNPIAFSQIFALHKGTAYILTLGTAPENLAAMKQQASVVIQTWVFLT